MLSDIKVFTRWLEYQQTRQQADYHREAGELPSSSPVVVGQHWLKSQTFLVPKNYTFFLSWGFMSVPFPCCKVSSDHANCIPPLLLQPHCTRLLLLTPFCSPLLMQEITRTLNRSSLSLLNSGTPYILLYFQWPMTWMHLRERFQDIYPFLLGNYQRCSDTGISVGFFV